MRILLAHNSLYYPAHGGGDKSNRLLMEALAARGHEVRVTARIERFGTSGHENFLHELSIRGISGNVLANGSVQMTLAGVDVRTLTMDSKWRSFFSAEMEAFNPEVIITSTDDPAQLLFDLAVKSSARVVYLVRATIAVPFGPESSSLSQERTLKLKQADAVVGVSHYVAGYCCREGGLDAVHVPISLMDTSTPQVLGRFQNPFVVMANPCSVKGIDILLGMADRMPETRFAAIPMWGTTTRDRAELLRRSNITLLEPFDRIDDLMTLARVTLVPSVWHEARSRMIVESMARAVPVIASDVGGIHEAMLGVDYLLPVRPVEHYQPAVDEHMVPVAIVPPQNVDPWVEALTRLVTDPGAWSALSLRSREAALRYLEHLNVLPFEQLLQGLLSKPKRQLINTNTADDKKRLLALLMKKRATAGNPWLPLPAVAPRLFCFPYAGGGTIGYRQWKLPLSVSPVLLPGRETRLSERPIDRMDELVNAIAQALDPHLDEPYAIYGHSVGAIVGFELQREFQKRGRPLAKALIVSGARAPQYRRNWMPPPEPSETELIEELRRLGGLPEQVLDNPELRRVALIPLIADTRMYRNYVYAEGDPLPVPIFAYGGSGDPNVSPMHVAGWHEQTTAMFARREFAGGHFFVETKSSEVQTAIASDLTQVGLTTLRHHPPQ